MILQPGRLFYTRLLRSNSSIAACGYGIIIFVQISGIGKKFQITTASEEKFVIVIHDDGRRDLYHFDGNDPDETISSVTLDDTEARQIASILGGMVYKPKLLETVEVALDDLVIEWIKVEPNFKGIGQCVVDLDLRKQTGATILAIVDKHSQKVNPGPGDIITKNSTLVVAGERKQIQALKNLLMVGC